MATNGHAREEEEAGVRHVPSGEWVPASRTGGPVFVPVAGLRVQECAGFCTPHLSRCSTLLSATAAVQPLHGSLVHGPRSGVRRMRFSYRSL